MEYFPFVIKWTWCKRGRKFSQFSPSARLQLCSHSTLSSATSCDVTAEKIGKKCRWSCYSSAAVRFTTLYTGGRCVGQLVFTLTVSTGGPVPSLPSKPKVLEMYFVLVVVVVQCSAVVACYLIMGAHRVHKADQKQASCKEAVGLCLKNKLRK